MVLFLRWENHQPAIHLVSPVNHFDFPCVQATVTNIFQPGGAKNQSHPDVEPQTAVKGIPAATSAREMKEGPDEKSKRN